MRPLLKPGQPAPVHATPGAHAGFDYPTQLVGASKWKGSDGKPIMVYVDPSTGTQGQTAAAYVLSKIDDMMAACDLVFGVKGASGNVIIAPDFGGAYHYGCSFAGGGDWYESVGDGPTVLGLVMAEVTESYMGLQAKGWNCGGSGGEALSRVLAEWVSGGPSGALSAYASGPSWTGADWISQDQGTDQEYPSIGCGVLYLWWMLKTFTLQQITQAGEPDGTLASNWAALTGHDKSLAFAAFKSAVGNLPASSDNPFGTPNPTYPPVSGPPNPPMPPGPSGKLHIAGSLYVDLPDSKVGTVGIITGTSKILVALTEDDLKTAASLHGLTIPVEIWALLAKYGPIILNVVIPDLFLVYIGAKTWAQVILDVEAAVANGMAFRWGFSI